MRLTISLVFAALFLVASPALADEVVKKDGKSIKGYIVAQTSRMVRILDAQGRVQRISMKDVDAVIEGPETGDQAVDAKLEEIDTDDADELAEVAKWAKSEKNKAWKVVANMALRADEDQATAHELLGHILVGDTWYTSKKKADAAVKKLAKQIMKDAGYVLTRGRYIKKEDRALFSKDKKAFVEDTQEFEGIPVPVWRDKATVMAEKGYTLMNGKWVKAGTPQDKSDMEEFKKLIGEDIWIVTTEHFRLYVMNVPPDEVSQYADLCEKTYDWFLEKMGLPKDTKLFRNNKGHLWVFKDHPTSLEWFKHYRNRFSLDDQFAKLMQGSGSVLAAGLLLSIDTPNEGRQRVPHTLVNHSARFCLQAYSPGIGRAGTGGKGDPAHWVNEGFGVKAEHDVLGNGVIVHSTLAKYGGSAGRADKRFETKDADDRAEGYAREGDDPIAGIDKLELNSLSGDHIAKAYTIIRWLMKEDIEKFRAWLKLRNTSRNLEALEKAFGWSPGEIDSKWRKMALK